MEIDEKYIILDGMHRYEVAHESYQNDLLPCYIYRMKDWDSDAQNFLQFQSYLMNLETRATIPELQNIALMLAAEWLFCYSMAYPGEPAVLSQRELADYFSSLSREEGGSGPQVSRPAMHNILSAVEAVRRVPLPQVKGGRGDAIQLAGRSYKNGADGIAQMFFDYPLLDKHVHAIAPSFGKPAPDLGPASHSGLEPSFGEGAMVEVGGVGRRKEGKINAPWAASPAAEGIGTLCTDTRDPQPEETSGAFPVVNSLRGDLSTWLENRKSSGGEGEPPQASATNNVTVHLSHAQAQRAEYLLVQDGLLPPIKRTVKMIVTRIYVAGEGP
jgi:hypothetical protein